MISDILKPKYEWVASSVSYEQEIIFRSIDLRREFVFGIMPSTLVVVYYEGKWVAATESRTITADTFEGVMEAYLAYSTLVDSFPEKMREVAKEIKDGFTSSPVTLR